MFDHLLVGEAQDGDALTAEEGVAESIASLSRGVGRAVHLDGQFGFDAKEVGEEVADGELSTELEAVDLSAAQQAPPERFGRGGAVAVPADSLCHSWKFLPTKRDPPAVAGGTSLAPGASAISFE